MKPITLHPVSVLVGLALGGLALLVAGAAQTPISTKTIFVGQVPAEWWIHVSLSTAPDGSLLETFTVPAGHHLVATGAVGNVYADGQGNPQLAAITHGQVPIWNGTRAVFDPGAVLTASAGGSASIWGYLEPSR